jgi:hypothetical protein
MTPTIMRYIIWTAPVIAGAVLGMCDWRWIRRPWLGVLLVGVLCGGLITMQVSPFNFADGGYALQGLLAAGAAGLALVGYVAASIVQFAIQRSRGRRP